MGLFSRKTAVPAGGALTIHADARGISRARTRLADLRKARAWHLAQPNSAKRRRRLEEIARAIRHYEAALESVRGALNGEDN